MSADPSKDLTGIDEWFVSEVLPLEAMLVSYLRRNWDDASEVADLRQEIYIKVYEAAQRKRPSPVKPYLFLVARNLLIDRYRHKNVVHIDTMADTDWLTVSDHEPAPDDRVAARQDLKCLQDALNSLPPRCRQVVILRRVHGYSQAEVAQAMGIKEETVESQIVKGMRALTDAMSERRTSSSVAGRFWKRKG